MPFSRAVVQHIKMRPFPFILIAITLLSQIALSQETIKRKTRFPIWTFHESNVTINGISVGAFSWLGNDRNTVTNGIRLEVPGIGIMALAGNGSPISDIDTIPEGIKREDFEFSEIVNGINLSTGSWGEMNYNGVTLALVAQNGYLANGMAAAFVWNSINKVNGVSVGGFLANECLHHNGFQIGGFGNLSIIMYGMQLAVRNEAKTMRGVQIGLYNKTYNSKGVQFGLWNINEHRKLPIINWSFGKKK